MLQQIQSYLFKYKKVAVPEVGTFELAHSPAVLDVANQMVTPPVTAVQFSGHPSVSGHQLTTFAFAYENDTKVAEQELARFGEAFRTSLQQQPFFWDGIGVLGMAENNGVQFSAGDGGSLLMPVAAQKVLRENVPVNVLVGDQEVQYTADEYEADPSEQPVRSWLMAACWIIVACAAAFILYYFYVNNWSAEASGLKHKPAIEESPVQHR